MDRDLKYFVDMWSAANRIMDRTRGRVRSDLDTDQMLQETVYWQTCVLGEAADHLFVRFRDEHPDTPSNDVAGIRNRLIHGFRDINNGMV